MDSLGYNDDNGVNRDASVLPCYSENQNQVCILICFLISFQIRTESMSCLTFHHVYGSQGANRTAGLNLQKCIDRAHSPVAAVYQVWDLSMFSKKIIYSCMIILLVGSRHMMNALVKNKDDIMICILRRVCMRNNVTMHI